MKDRIKSWESTVIGLIALIGLGYKAYTSGGFEVSDFLILVTGVGFIGAKHKGTLKQRTPKVSNTINPDREYPDERG
tara:strand:+ start:542 stop:772 length:231 start_codon:yes stop_codon:yes gene_type:complete